ncbi:MAG: pyridoxal phosphate-dependent transferase, partial [Olpidium bornovanus]
RVAQRCRDFLAARVRTAPRVVEFAIAPPGPRSLRDAAPDRGCGGGERAAADADPDADPRARLSGRVAVHAVFFAGEDSGAAKEFWQHAGEGASSRFAEHCLRVFAAREEGRAERGAHGDREAKLSAREERPAAGRASTAGPLEGPGNAAGCGRGRYRCQGGGGGPRAFGLRRQEPAAAAPNAAAGGEEEDGGPEIEVFLGERYGRNVDVAAAAGAKLTLRRRIASALRGDRADGRDGGVSNAVAPRVSEKDVFLFPSGMSAIYNIHRLLLKTRGERASVQFGRVGNRLKSVDAGGGKRGVLQTLCNMLPGPSGEFLSGSFPYLDTLKVLEKFGPGCVFFGHGDEADMERLETALADRGERDPVLAVFCEFPSNPLLKSPDLRRLRALADRHDFVLVVDETIGNFVNVAVLQYADVTVTSLTKVFSGDSDVMDENDVLKA